MNFKTSAFSTLFLKLLFTEMNSSPQPQFCVDKTSQRRVNMHGWAFCYWHFILMLSFLIYSIMYFNSAKQIKAENKFAFLPLFISTWRSYFQSCSSKFQKLYISSSPIVVRTTWGFAYTLCKLSGVSVRKKWSHSAYLNGK